LAFFPAVDGLEEGGGVVEWRSGRICGKEAGAGAIIQIPMLWANHHRNRIHHMLKIINNAGHRLQSLIENYLFYAQLELMGQTEEGRSRLQHGTGIADPSLILFDSVQQAAEAANRANDIVWCDRLDLWVDISDGNLARIVHEIIDNALKFSKPGTPIELALQTTPHYYIIHITDHGYGMSEENIRKVGAFMQFDRKTREQQGAGLGLVIAQRLTALHGGQLQIESQLGVGTQVSIQLPLIPEPA
jgi:signal transduction histidine kinase